MTSNTTVISNTLAWLADAPLFIDADQIDRFYDAVVSPENEKSVNFGFIRKKCA